MRLGIVLAFGEEDVWAERECAGTKCLCSRLCPCICVNPDVTEIGAKSVFHEDTRFIGERLTFVEGRDVDFALCHALDILY
jgi:hypothetical protein